MKRFVITLVSCLLFVFAMQASGAAAATQGDFALALAQILGFEVNTVDQAVNALTRINVRPDNGWQVQETLSYDIIRQVEEALNRAVAAGLLKPVQAEGAIAAAAASLGYEYPLPGAVIPRAETTVPWYAPLAGPPPDPVFILEPEASPYRALPE